jgi:hypothetical protein
MHQYTPGTSPYPIGRIVLLAYCGHGVQTCTVMHFLHRVTPGVAWAEWHFEVF